jgi:hypothetical protein
MDCTPVLDLEDTEERNLEKKEGNIEQIGSASRKETVGTGRGKEGEVGRTSHADNAREEDTAEEEGDDIQNNDCSVQDTNSGFGDTLSDTVREYRHEQDQQDEEEERIQNCRIERNEKGTCTSGLGQVIAAEPLKVSSVPRTNLELLSDIGREIDGWEEECKQL